MHFTQFHYSCSSPLDIKISYNARNTRSHWVQIDDIKIVWIVTNLIINIFTLLVSPLIDFWYRNCCINGVFLVGGGSEWNRSRKSCGQVCFILLLEEICYIQMLNIEGSWDVLDYLAMSDKKKDISHLKMSLMRSYGSRPNYLTTEKWMD